MITKRPHGAIKKTSLAGFLAYVVLASGCASLGAWDAARFGKHEAARTPAFEAHDRSYFPDFILDFFPNATLYQQDFPSLAEAKTQMQLIEVKRLNQEENQVNEANLSWSANGHYLSFEAVDGNTRKIKLKDLTGKFQRELAVISAGNNDFLDGILPRAIHSYNAGLSWSHDSTRYAFMSNGGIGVYNIYLGSIDGTENPIAPSESKDGYAVWSPVNREIAFVSSRSGHGDIYLYNQRERRLQQLTQSDAIDIFPQWFPDGRRIVYSSGDAMHHDLYIVTRDQSGAWSNPHQLTNWAQDDLRPSVSPDGRLIAFYATDPYQKEGDSPAWNIHVVPYIRGKTYSQQELLHTAVATDVMVDLNTGPAWTPDSRKIFYVKRDPQNFNPIHGYELFSGRAYIFNTETKMNRDILVSNLGILSFRAQVGVWDRVFVALTNQGRQLQGDTHPPSRIHFLRRNKNSGALEASWQQGSLR